jgi:hypothetical protein
MTREEIKVKYRDSLIDKCLNCKELFKLSFRPAKCLQDELFCKTNQLLNIIADKDLLIDEVIKEIENKILDRKARKFDYNEIATLESCIQIIKDKLKE